MRSVCIVHVHRSVQVWSFLIAATNLATHSAAGTLSMRRNLAVAELFDGLHAQLRLVQHLNDDAIGISAIK
jgi:hypothetical protein